ncbi:MAG TPA: sigma-70 family RNA polymerase sigma factor [Candidatus Peribacteria bacterium]|nr:sigma-70 family RNA polymerase sigma factor [Candidatus Peribacteria bacterium]
MDSTELAAVAACQAGRLSEFDTLYTQHVDAVYRYLYRRTLVREVAEDLTSTAFLKAMESIRSFDPDKGNLRAWLYRIARNGLIDYYRTRRPSADIESVWDLPGDEVSTLVTERRIESELLHKALATLTADQREIVLLRVWEGLSHKEIAALTGKTEANSKVLFSRAVAELRTQLPSLAILLLFPHLL